MYDTIAITYEGDDLFTLAKFLQKAKTVNDIDTCDVLYISGFIKNLRCRINKSQLKIEGSLPEYFWGTNLKTMDLQNTKDAIIRLGNEFGIDLTFAKVSKIHIAENLIMRNPVQMYLEKLGYLSRYNQSIYQGGVLYSNRTNAITFYDKVEEQKRRKRKLDPEIEKQSILRVELKLNKRIYNTLNRKMVFVKDLYDPVFYTEVVTLWVRFYHRINKARANQDSLDYFSPQVNSFIKNLAFIGVQSLGGVNKVMDMIQVQYKIKGCTRSQYSRLMSKTKEISIGSTIRRVDQLVKELDEKIDQTFSKINLSL
jgi:hypothetical protein